MRALDRISLCALLVMAAACKGQPDDTRLFPEIAAMYSSTSLNGETSDNRRGVTLFEIGLGGSFGL